MPSAPTSSPYRTSTEEHTHCFLCGSEGAPGSECTSCLVERPRLDAEAHAAVQCPRCLDPLVTMHVGGGANAHACTRCHGIFAPPRAWSRFWRVPDTASDLDRRFPHKFGPSLTPLVACSTCRIEMERARFSATSNIVIDVCPRAHGIWLDAGELRLVLAYAGHKARIGDEAARREADNGWRRPDEELERRIALEVSLVEGEEAGRRYSDGIVRAAGKRFFFKI